MTSNKVNKYPRTIYLLKRIDAEFRPRINVALSEFNITGSQYSVLSLANRSKPLSSAQISRRMFTTPQTTSDVISSLEKKKLIERYEDPENKRILRIRVTDHGRKLLKACDLKVDELEEEFFGVLDDSELQELRGTLDKVFNHWKQKEN